MSTRWMAVFTAIMGIYLYVAGGIAIWGIDATSSITIDAAGPFSSEESVARAKGQLPLLYLWAIEGIGAGTLAFIAAGALFTRRAWAFRALAWATIFLAVMALAILAYAPAAGSWGLQVVFLAFSATIWWELWRMRKEKAARL